MAGKRKGTADDRWLWPEFYRAICEIKPRWVLVENVPGLLSIDSGRVFGGILRDLAEGGYDAEWQVLSAAQFGAPHLRFRVFLVAYAAGDGLHNTGGRILQKPSGEPEEGQDKSVVETGRLGSCPDVPNPVQPGTGMEIYRSGGQGRQFAGTPQPEILRQDNRKACSEGIDASSADVPNPPQRQDIIGEPGDMAETAGGRESIDTAVGNGGADVADSIFKGLEVKQIKCHGEKQQTIKRSGDRREWWSVDRLKCLGNAVVPQVAQWIGDKIMEAEG